MAGCCAYCVLPASPARCSRTYDRAPIDPHGPELVYKVVANRIERRIRAGEFGDSGRLPSETDLAEWYGVARMTVRRAHEELTERGLARIST